MTVPDDAEDSGRSGAAAVSWNAFFSTYLPAMVLALGTGIALPALPALAKSFDVSFAAASGVVTMFLFGSLAGAIPAGWLIDRFGTRPVMIAGPLLTAAVALLVAFADSFPELLVLRFFNGCATQMWMMSRLAVISHRAAAGQRGRQVTWMFGMDHTGKLAGPVVGGIIGAQWGPQAAFLAYALVALLAAIPTWLFAEGTQPRARDDGPAPATAARWLAAGQLIRSRLVYFALALFAGFTRGPSQADLMHLYAAFAYHLGPLEIGYLATAAALISWPIGFLAGWLMDRFGRKRTMVPGFGGVALAMTALALSALLELSFTWYVVLYLTGVVMQGLTSGSVQTVGADVAPPDARGTFLGLWRFTTQGGATVSPVMFAVLAGLSYTSAFLYVAACAGTVAFLLVRYVPETRDAS